METQSQHWSWIQKTLAKQSASEHLQYTNEIIPCGQTEKEQQAKPHDQNRAAEALTYDEISSDDPKYSHSLMAPANSRVDKYLGKQYSGVPSLVAWLN